jgi:alkaline phosphatase D
MSRSDRVTRREILRAAAAMGATFAFGSAVAAPSRRLWVERRDLFAEGVASGDPGPGSIILWTRASNGGRATAVPLTVEVAEDPAFKHVIATAPTRALAAADHTCRVLVGGLRPATMYWYRFVGENGNGSRIGRTRTAPADEDPRPVQFAFVSCQNVCEGAQNAYRRMAYDDDRARPEEQLWFVLHLGDFVYEVVDYPEDFPGGHRYDRRLRPAVRYPQGEKIRQGFHIPVSLADYRTLYRSYLHDPDLQDARARWPFVSMWDNHEFSWLGWQSFEQFDGINRPAQTRKVMANQAWFEYQPARLATGGRGSLERFDAPAVKDAPIERFDENGLGQEPNNLAAIGSLTGYRALRFGRHVELLITDQHSYRSEDPGSRKEAASLTSGDFPSMAPEEMMEALDAGRAHAGGAPKVLSFGSVEVPNFRKNEPAQTILGAEQKAWFLKRLANSRATWKVWGNSEGTLDWRADPQNLPDGTGARWPGKGYASLGGGDYGTAYVERAEIYDAVRDRGITGFVTVSGDRHSFWAGLAAKALPPARFEPVGVAFVTGSISAPGLVEAYEHRFPKDHPLRPLYVADVGGKMKPAVNLLMHHGVRACLEYQRTGDLAAARRASNPDLAPHLSFLDMGGHGYAIARFDADAMACEFVCIPRPLERSEGDDGGPVLYRVTHRAARWKAGQPPRLEQRVVEGDPGLGV